MAIKHAKGTSKHQNSGFRNLFVGLQNPAGPTIMAQKYFGHIPRGRSPLGRYPKGNSECSLAPVGGT